jgi:glutamyl-tRNA synthetase
MTELKIRSRFAPSPTGEIHLGNLRTALFNYLYARGNGGVFLLRIEDTDVERSRAEYAEALMRDLRWLGIEWQEGPGADGECGPYFQAQRLDVYQNYYQMLEQAGACYPCFCSDAKLKLARKAQRAAGQPPRYPGTCAHLSADEVKRKLKAGEKPTLRFRVPPAQQVEFEDLVRGGQRFATSEIGDFIIRRSDGGPSFFFTNAIDDALMGVTHVLRGEDHLTNTPRQLMILHALGLPAPSYGHLSLLVGTDGSPLSKRHGSRSVRELREGGYLPAALVNYLARLGHTYQSDALADLEDLARGFSVQRLGKAPARYDESQLGYWQKEAIAALPGEKLLAWYKGCADYDQYAGRLTDERLQQLFDVVRDNIEMPSDVSAWIGHLTGDQANSDAEGQKVLKAAGTAFFEHALNLLDEHAEDFRGFAKAVGEAAGAKGKGLFMPLRVALTGVSYGPEMARVWQWLGVESCRTRLEAARDRCAAGAEPDVENL